MILITTEIVSKYLLDIEDKIGCGRCQSDSEAVGGSISRNHTGPVLIIGVPHRMGTRLPFVHLSVWVRLPGRFQTSRIVKIESPDNGQENG